MSLYEGAVKKPIMTSLCFLAVVIFWSFLFVQVTYRLVSGHRYKYDHGNDRISWRKCFGYRK